MKSYSQLRKTMSEKYEETDFGPTAVSEPTKSMEEVSKEEFKDPEQKKNADGQQKAIKLGYDRIKAKVKKLRSNFQKACSKQRALDLEELSTVFLLAVLQLTIKGTMT